jgi:hypothetical protein
MNRYFRRTSIALLLALPVVLTGCARFANPAVAESGPAFDRALEGRWELRNEDESAELEIRREGAAGLITVRSEESGQAKVERAPMVTARLGQLNLVSFQSQAPADRGYWSIFRYDIEGDRLVITPGDDAYWRIAVEDGRLEGEVEQGTLTTSVTVTASEAQLRAVILGYGAVIFADDPTPEFVFERLR